MSLVDTAMTRMLARSVRRVEPVLDPPAGLVADTYEQMIDEVGLLPPFVCQAGHPDVLAAAWTLARETWLAGPAGRLEREAVAAGISSANTCPFCVEAHTMTLRAGGHRDAAASIRRARPGKSAANGSSDDPAVAPFAAWGAATLDPQSPLHDQPPFPDVERPWFVGTAVTFHYVNRVVNVLLDESGVPGPLRRLGGVADRVADALVGRPMLALNPRPGRSLPLLSDPGATPPDLRWADADPTVAAACARVDATFTQVGEASLSADVRALVGARVSRWRGETPGLSAGWARDAASVLAPADRPAAELALLVALASHQVGDSVVDAFRRVRPSDAHLVGVVGWSAWIAARRIGGWLAR